MGYRLHSPRCSSRQSSVFFFAGSLQSVKTAPQSMRELSVHDQREGREPCLLESKAAKLLAQFATSLTAQLAVNLRLFSLGFLGCFSVGFSSRFQS